MEEQNQNDLSNSSQTQGGEDKIDLVQDDYEKDSNSSGTNHNVRFERIEQNVKSLKNKLGSDLQDLYDKTKKQREEFEDKLAKTEEKIEEAKNKNIVVLGLFVAVLSLIIGSINTLLISGLPFWERIIIFSLFSATILIFPFVLKKVIDKGNKVDAGRDGFSFWNLDSFKYLGTLILTIVSLICFTFLAKVFMDSDFFQNYNELKKHSGVVGNSNMKSINKYPSLKN